jgi:hypothetical protein
VLNTTARSIAGLRRSDQVRDAMASFQWLRVPERVWFKIAVLTFRALHRMAPRYLSDDLRRIADFPSRGRLRSAATNRLDIRPARLKMGYRVRLRLPAHGSGSRYPMTSSNFSRFRCFVGSSKPIYLSFPILKFICFCSVYGYLIYLIVALQFFT